MDAGGTCSKARNRVQFSNQSRPTRGLRTKLSAGSPARSDAVTLRKDMSQRDDSLRNVSDTAPRLSSHVLTAMFFLSFFLLFSSGRMSSSDAGSQLQAAINFVNMRD